MAFKFQLGAATMSGSLAQEGEIAVYDDSSNRQIRLKNSNGYISGSGGLDIGGNFTALYGTISASAGVSGQTFTTDNASLSAVGVVSGSGAANFGGNITSHYGSLNAYTTVSGAGAVNGQSFATDNASLSAAGIVSGSGAFTAGGNISALYGTLSASAGIAGQSLTIANVAVVSTTAQLQNVISISGAGVIEGASLNINAGNSTAGGFEVSTAGAISGAAGIQFGGTVRLDGIASATPILTADSLFFKDVSSNGQFKTVSFNDYATQIAGAGLTATNGVLSTDAGTATSASAPWELSEGYNYFGPRDSVTIVSLPSGTVGDVVYVNAGSGLSVSAYILVSGSESNDKIMGNDEIRIESPYASVGFVYCESRDWRII